MSFSPRVAAITLLISAACSGIGPVPSTAADLEVANGTTMAVALAVNGTVLTNVAPGARESIAPSRLPTLPWRVEARMTSGRVLASMTVRAGDVQKTALPDGSTMWKGDAIRVDLSCGRLDMWSGPPLAGPAPGPGSPGDCDP